MSLRCPSATLLLALAAAAPSLADGADDRLKRLAAASGQSEFLMRIGLESAHSVSITGKGPFKVLDAATGRPVWRESYEGELRVVAQGGPKGEDVAAVYRVQVGAYGSRQAADEERLRLEHQLGVEGVVRHDPDRGNWRVRIGAASDRLSLNPLVERLRLAGLQGLWIAEEPLEVLAGVSMRLVDESFDSLACEASRLIVVPEGQGQVAVEGKSYRGVIELRLTGFGTVRPINWIGLESYLRGVVPAELGPEMWPQLQALAAQAIAARTYAWRNRGQFSDEGFDLCATPRCQVYQGAGAEHPLSDRAIWTTRGQILTWEGQPIVALYTATCGGHTEDGREVFADHDQPYLRGVPCRAEGDALATHRGTVTGQAMVSVRDETGAEVTRDVALLRAAGVLTAAEIADGAAGRPLDGDTLRGWTRRLSRLAGRPEPRGEAGSVESLGQAASALVADLAWDERASVLVSAEDVPALLRDPATAALDDTDGRALAYLAWVEALRPFPDGSFHAGERPTRARMVPALVRIAESYNTFGLRTAVVSGVGQAKLRMVQGKGEIALKLTPDAFLFGRAGGETVAVERLEIWPGDSVRFRTNSAGRIEFLELIPPVKGISDDRSAKVYSWEVRRTRRELEAAINRRVSVGRLEDLQVVRRGVSGRVVELKVVGSRATTVIRGFDVRRLLDTRESLLVIEVQRDGKGKIEAVVFAGKGWGHGVGLCQVGAYGMALRGADHRQILGHYYSGAKLSRLGPKEP